MKVVQMFETTDGQLFRGTAEAEKHEAKVKTDTEAAKLMDAFILSGYSKEAASIYVRGWRVGVQFFATGQVPPSRKRAGVGTSADNAD